MFLAILLSEPSLPDRKKQNNNNNKNKNTLLASKQDMHYPLSSWERPSLGFIPLGAGTDQNFSCSSIQPAKVFHFSFLPMTSTYTLHPLCLTDPSFRFVSIDLSFKDTAMSLLLIVSCRHQKLGEHRQKEARERHGESWLRFFPWRSQGFFQEFARNKPNK